MTLPDRIGLRPLLLLERAALTSNFSDRAMLVAIVDDHDAVEVVALRRIGPFEHH